MRRLLLVLAAIFLALPAAAQQVPVVQAGAEGRFERQIDAKSKVEGFSPAQVAAFRAAIAPVIEQLAAMPGVNNPPAPICHRLGSWVQLVNPDGVLGAEISMLTPISFENGRCHRMTAGGLQIWVNRPNGLSRGHAVVPSPRGGGSGWYVLDLKPPRNPRLVEYELNGDRYAFITHGHGPIFRPVTIGRYLEDQIATVRERDAQTAARNAQDRFTEADLQKWLAEEKPRLAAEYAEQTRAIAPYAQPGQLEKMRASNAKLLADLEAAMRQKVVNYAARDAQAVATPSEAGKWSAALAALSPAQRAMPACIGPRGDFQPDAACPAGRTLIEVNPAYFDKARPTEVQLLVLTTPSHRYHGESDQKLAVREQIWASLDRAALATRVR